MAGLRRAFVGLGYSYRVNIKQGLELAVELNRGLERIKAQDNRALVSLRLSR